MTVYKKVNWGRYYEIVGDESEVKVLEVLLQLKRQKLISSYKRTKKNSIEDQNGVDFWIYQIQNGVTIKAMPLQVKSSWRAKEEHLKKHENIPCVSARETLEKILLKMIRAHFKKQASAGFKERPAKHRIRQKIMALRGKVELPGQ